MRPPRSRFSLFPRWLHGGRWSLVLGPWALLMAAGCSRSPADKPAKVSADKEPAAVTSVERPQWLPLHRKVRQPGTVQAYERTLIFAKVAGYVRKWHVDRDDRVRKGQTLVELAVPELEVELKQKAALVQQAEAEVTYARAVVEVAEAEHKRLKSQSERLARVGRSGVLDQENVEEARFGYESARARVEQARAAVAVKGENLKVARESHAYTRTMLGYATLTAPYDGVVTRRSVDTGAFVQPASGPLYVVERRDRMRVFVDVPEADAGWVSKGTAVHVHVPALGGSVFKDRVARTSYALDRTTRTLVAEIDLENPGDQLRPGMYAHGTILATSPKMLSVSAAAILTEGDVLQGYRNYCFLVEDGKVRRIEVQVGVRGDDRVQLLKKQVRPAGRAAEPAWEDFTGAECIVRGTRR